MKETEQHQAGKTCRKPCTRAALPALIALALASTAAHGQQDTAPECEEVQGTPPGLYVTTDEGKTFLIQGDKTVELAPGQAAYANENKLSCIKSVPRFLDWPCSTDAANSRKFATYSVAELPDKELVKEVVRRYFEIPQVIEPIPNWIDGESTVNLDFSELIPYATPDYWYKPDPGVDPMDPKRPKTLLISLYVGINQVVLDNYQVDLLRKHYAGQKIPVVFVFNDSNVVPISYFGANVSLEELNKAFNERRIKIAEVPMWPLGDHHLEPTVEEFEKLFDLPDLDAIDPQRREAVAAQLETFGFSRKPIFVTMMEGGRMYIDDPVRVRVAISMGIKRLPTVVNFVEQDEHLRRCGPGTPAGSSGVTGATTPIGGPLVPPGVTPPPPPEQPASES